MKETPISKDGLAQKLRALQNMTVANGCTESEALVAAAKAAELLERYGLSLEELKAAAPDQICDSDSVDCGRRHTHEAQFLAPKIAEFTKTKIWLSRTRTDVRLTFFGLKADVQIASYLFTVFRTAMETEWAIYWVSNKEEHQCHGKTVRKSFLMGMIERLNARLSALIEAAKSGPALSESREIIVLKAQIVEKAFRDLNLRLEKSRRTTSVYFDSRAIRCRGTGRGKGLHYLRSDRQQSVNAIFLIRSGAGPHWKAALNSLEKGSAFKTSGTAEAPAEERECPGRSRLSPTKSR